MFGFGKKAKRQMIIFHPQPDITAYELAMILKLFLFRFPDEKKLVSQMPQSCHKHFHFTEIDS